LTSKELFEGLEISHPYMESGSKRYWPKGYHEGLDYTFPKYGFAFYDGIVELQTCFAFGPGCFVRLRHQYQGITFYTEIQHLKRNSFRFKVGELVTVGDAVGDMGCTGNCLGAHVHIQEFGIERNQDCGHLGVLNILLKQ
jgi:murein DD-endopeptidase MepM/ murein hydrolase activator NlpD